VLVMGKMFTNGDFAVNSRSALRKMNRMPRQVPPSTKQAAHISCLIPNNGYFLNGKKYESGCHAERRWASIRDRVQRTYGNRLMQSMVGQVMQNPGASMAKNLRMPGINPIPCRKDDWMNREVSASAFMNGRDNFMGECQYDPRTIEGKGVLAHELAHVAQQTGRNIPANNQIVIQRKTENLPEAPVNYVNINLEIGVYNNFSSLDQGIESLNAQKEQLMKIRRMILETHSKDLISGLGTIIMREIGQVIGQINGHNIAEEIKKSPTELEQNYIHETYNQNTRNNEEPNELSHIKERNSSSSGSGHECISDFEPELEPPRKYLGKCYLKRVKSMTFIHSKHPSPASMFPATSNNFGQALNPPFMSSQGAPFSKNAALDYKNNEEVKAPYKINTGKNEPVEKDIESIALKETNSIKIWLQEMTQEYNSAKTYMRKFNLLFPCFKKLCGYSIRMRKLLGIKPLEFASDSFLLDESTINESIMAEIGKELNNQCSKFEAYPEKGKHLGQQIGEKKLLITYLVEDLYNFLNLLHMTLPALHDWSSQESKKQLLSFLNN
jgi:hypothetical protein